MWLFFEESIPLPTLARKLNKRILLTETVEHRPEAGLDSYDRFFPNQDTLPRGGFGNLIALPLQKEARETENTVFLNREFIPFPDEWSCLSEIGKINRSMVDDIVREAEQRGRIVGIHMAPADDDDANPWLMPPSRRRQQPRIVWFDSQTSVELVFGNEIYIAKHRPAAGVAAIDCCDLAAFQNPEFYKAQSMRLSTLRQNRAVISCAEDHIGHIALPPADAGQSSVNSRKNLRLASRRRSRSSRRVCVCRECSL